MWQKKLKNMKIVSYIKCRPLPQPRITQKVSFLFSNTLSYWEKVDNENKAKSKLNILNRNGKPFKPTRYADRLRRLQNINSYRENIYNVVLKETNGNIPTQNLFIFFLFKTPKNLSKKKKIASYWTLHEKRPDVSNLVKALEDALYIEDSMVNSCSYYKLWCPDEFEGIIIIENKEIHEFAIESMKQLINIT